MFHPKYMSFFCFENKEEKKKTSGVGCLESLQGFFVWARGHAVFSQVCKV